MEESNPAACAVPSFQDWLPTIQRHPPRRVRASTRHLRLDRVTVVWWVTSWARYGRTVRQSSGYPPIRAVGSPRYVVAVSGGRASDTPPLVANGPVRSTSVAEPIEMPSAAIQASLFIFNVDRPDLD